MPTPLEKACAYLDALEAEWLTALALSQQKAEEAKLIKARQEGFAAAVEMFGGKVLADKTDALNSKEPDRRHTRRRIPQLILRELSFSGHDMTARQIAKAIDYNLERTETALRRMEEAGQVLRNGKDRWAIDAPAMVQVDERVVSAVNGNPARRQPLKEGENGQ